MESGFAHDDVKNFTARVLNVVKEGLKLDNMELLEEAEVPEEEEDVEEVDLDSEEGDQFSFSQEL